MSHPPHPTPSEQWTLAQLIDYELYLDADKHLEHNALVQRDSEIRTHILAHTTDQASQEDTPRNRRWWLHQWLSVRQQQQKDSDASVGEISQSSIATLSGSATVITAVLGFTSALGLLATDKVIFVSVALAIYILPQLLFLTLAVCASLSQRFNWSLTLPLALRSLLGWLLKRITSKHDLSQPSEIKIQKMQAAAGLLMGRGKLRRDALGWPLLVVLQKAGTTFAISVVIGITLVSLSAPRNFGWGSSAKWIDPPLVYSTTKALSAPWSKLIPEGIGSPTLDEVKRSQTFIGRDLPPDFPHLSSWWQFLCLCLITYTVLPRILLLAYSKRQSRLALHRENFVDAKSDQLFRRLVKPQLVTAVSRTEDSLVAEEPISHPPISTAPSTVESVPPGHCEILTELELDTQQLTVLKNRFREMRNLGTHQCTRVYSEQERTSALTRLKALEWQDGVPRLIFLYRACDPIVANLRELIHASAKILENDAQLIFCLVSRRNSTTPPIQPSDLEAWTDFVNSLKLKYPNTDITDLTQTAP
ncbi:DUF2868 domain-containing protein [Rubritalea spongiae]|uniref:DUF2868 domain-containing protein n=1 Tax=Rubritalea spongiae TaxID=430797 RepID=A0ABW5E5G3_9BACT